MTGLPDELSWPISRAAEALEALCRHSALASGPGSGEAPPPPTGKSLAAWIERAVAGLGVEAEPVEAPYRQVEPLLAGAGPALLRASEAGEERLLVLLAGANRGLPVLTPDQRVVRVPMEQLRSALCREAEADVEPTVDRVIENAAIPVKRRARTRAALLRETLAASHIPGGWMIRPSPGGSLTSQVRELGLSRLLGLMLGAHAIYYALWILSWWLLGSIVLQGRLETSWLLAWGLLLLSLIPFRVLVTSVGGRLAVRASALLKRRLLFGALQLETDEVRRRGAGQLLGRVLETEVLDSMALSGGFLALTAIVELILAAVVLGLGAGGPLHVLFLAAAVVGLVLLGRRHLRRRRSWTDLRLRMTDDLVERMGGHRTRLAQEPRERWNEEEDQALARYLHLSVDLDGSLVGLKAVMPRGWLIVGLLGLAPAFVWGDPTSAALGVAIGGVLVAYRAFRSLGDGIERLAAAAIAWDRIQLFWKRALTEPVARATIASSVGESDRPARGDPLLEARDLVFRYPLRNDAVLQRVDLTIRGGDQLLLQGESGGGKSTLAALLAALRVPESGLLLCRGLDRPTRGSSGWRERIALVPQFHENHVLLGSLAFNLLMGRRWPPHLDDLEEAEGVCRSLGLGPLLERMPGGLEQMVGETGWQLSHGERSRVFLARALLQDADLLILDESLAALDPDTLRTTLGYVLEQAPSVLMVAHP